MSNWNASRWHLGFITAVHAVTGAAILAAAPAGALTIVPTFDSSVSSGEQATINSAISNIDSTLAGTNITVSIYFTNGCLTGSTCLGDNFEAGEGVNAPSYAAYTAALATDSAANPANTILSTAVSNLSKGNQADQVETTEANMAALGIACTACIYVKVGGTNYDGEAGINFANIAAGNPMFGAYDAQGTVVHEIDEILGIGGLGSILGDNCTGGGICTVGGSTYIGDMDLYRFECGGTGVTSLSQSASCAEFSVDGGVTDIMNFNQTSGGDWGDWANTIGGVGPAGCNPSVQSAWGCPADFSPSSTLGTAEIDAFEAIGYNTTSGTGNTPPPVPEPASLALAILGFSISGLGMIRRRRRH